MNSYMAAPLCQLGWEEQYPFQLVSSVNGYEICPGVRWTPKIGERIAKEVSMHFHGVWGLLGTRKDGGGKLHLIDLTQGLEGRVYWAFLLHKISEKCVNVSENEYYRWTIWARTEINGEFRC